MTNSVNRKLIGVYILAFILRVSFGLFEFIQKGTSEWLDSWAYLSLAENFLKQGFLVPNESLLKLNAIGLPPAYSLVITPIIYIFGDNYVPIVFLNALLSSFIPVVIFYIALKITNEKFAMIPALWAVFYPMYFLYVSSPLKESLLSLMVLMLLYLIIKYDVYKTKMIFLIALIYTFIFHIDERYLFYFPFIILIFVFKDATYSQKLIKVLTLCLFVLVLSLPWFARNYIVYDKIVFITLRTSQYTDKIFYKNSNQNKEFYNDFFEVQLSAEQIDSLRNGKTLSAFNYPDSVVSGNMNLFNTLKTIRHIQEGLKAGLYPHKYSFAERSWVEFKEFWRPFRFSNEFVFKGFRFEKPWSFRNNLISILSYGLLLPFMVAGMIFGIKYRNKPILILSITILLHTFLHIFILHVRTRYRLPIDSLIIIISFYGLFCLINKYFPKSTVSGMIGNKTE